MKLETLGFYLENLLPGIYMLCCIVVLMASSLIAFQAQNAGVAVAHTTTQSISTTASQLPNEPPLKDQLSRVVLNKEILLSAVFLTAAYLLGLISAMLTRCFIDPFSERFIRPKILSRKSHRTYSALYEILQSLGNYDLARPEAYTSPSDDDWNKLYRASLAAVDKYGSETGAAEVRRRREQGRLVRNLFFPFCLTPVTLHRLLGYPERIGCYCITGLVAGVAAGVAIHLYAYAEYFIFTEASLHLQAFQKKAQPGSSPFSG